VDANTIIFWENVFHTILDILYAYYYFWEPRTIFRRFRTSKKKVTFQRFILGVKPACFEFWKISRNPTLREMYQKHLSRYLKSNLANQEYPKVPKVHKYECYFFLSYLLEIPHYHFQPPGTPQKNAILEDFAVFCFFFQKRVKSMNIICQNLFFWQKYIMCIRPGLYFHCGSLKDSLNSENLGKKKKNAKCNIWLYKGLWHTVGFPGFRMCLKLLFIFWKKKTEFRSKKIFSRKLKMLHIWYPSFIFSRISRHTLVLDTYIVTCNCINLYPELAAISVPLRWR